MLILKTVLLHKLERIKEPQINGYWYLYDILSIYAMALTDAELNGDPVDWEQYEQDVKIIRFATFQLMRKASLLCDKRKDTYKQDFHALYLQLLANKAWKFEKIMNRCMGACNVAFERYKHINIDDVPSAQLHGRFVIGVASTYFDFYRWYGE